MSLIDVETDPAQTAYCLRPCKSHQQECDILVDKGHERPRIRLLVSYVKLGAVRATP